MIKETIYTVKSPYRDEFSITGYRFGKGEKACCIVGAIRGNEIQQLYVCSRIISELIQLERAGKIVHNNEILVVPSLNHFSMNIGKRFWSVDNRDINRMFPGNAYGETTQQIAAGVFNQVSGYQYGIQFSSFYIPGDFIPHVRLLDTGLQSTSLANLFGLPFIVLRKPRPFDKLSLNYNWQLNQTSAFSLYTTETDRIDEESAQMAVASVLRFLARMGIIKYNIHGGFMSTTIEEDSLLVIRSQKGGIYRRIIKPGDEVRKGQIMAEILHPYENTVLSEVVAPCDGIVFFAFKSPLVMQNTVLYRIIKRLHY
jgi:predicted deacylase